MPITQHVKATDGNRTTRVFRTPTIYPAYEKIETTEQMIPSVTFPPCGLDDPPIVSIAAPAIDMAMAERTVLERGSLKNTIIAIATASG